MIKHYTPFGFVVVLGAVACSSEATTAPVTPSKSTVTSGDDAAIAIPFNAGEEHRYLDAQPTASTLQSGSGGHVWSHQLTHAGASFVALHFQGFDLPPGAHLRVTDGSGEQGYELRGRGKMQAGTFWSQHVRGDTIRLELFTPVHETPFVIDRYTAGQPAGFGDRAICGVDDKRGAACYRDSHPEEYANARAVARLLTNGRGFCTGWLVGPDNLLLTNNHCIGTAESAMNTDYEFMAEDNECNVAGAGPSQIFSGGELLATSVPLDYALIRVNGNPSDEFGYLNVDDRVARIGEPIYIAGHPGGRLKELTIESTHPQDRGEIPRVFSVDEPPCTGGDSTDVGYFGDTEGGNSGSPVISAETHGVIALHHCANCPNRGVPIHRVLDEIEDFLISSQGKLDLNRETLACNGSFDMILRDLDLAEEVTQSVTVTTDAGDFETVELASIGGGAFRGSMSLNDSTANPGDLQVQAGHGDLVVVRYTDADDGSGSEAVAQDALFVDCIAPVMSSVAADALAFGAIVRADTDEEASATVRFGTSCEDLSSIVSGAVTITHQVTLEDLDPSTRYFFALEAQDPAGNFTSDDNFGECFQFETKVAPDTYFLENFSGNSPFDLAGKTMTLTPDGSANFYAACVTDIDALPTDPTGGTVLELGDDVSSPVTLAEPVTVFGRAINPVWVGSNGYITSESETRFGTFPGQFFQNLGVAGFKRDLNPQLGGTVTVEELSDRFVASWVAVRSFGSEDINTFQLELFHDGTIAISWLSIDAQNGVIGVSDGAGTPVNFAAADVSALVCE